MQFWFFFFWLISFTPNNWRFPSHIFLVITWNILHKTTQKFGNAQHIHVSFGKCIQSTSWWLGNDSRWSFLGWMTGSLPPLIRACCPDVHLSSPVSQSSYRFLRASHIPEVTLQLLRPFWTFKVYQWFAFFSMTIFLIQGACISAFSFQCLSALSVCLVFLLRCERNRSEGSDPGRGPRQRGVWQWPERWSALNQRVSEFLLWKTGDVVLSRTFSLYHALFFSALFSFVLLPFLSL